MKIVLSVIALIIVAFITYPTPCESLKYGFHSDQKDLVTKNKIVDKRIILKRTANEQSSLLSCYDCSAHNPDCGISQATVVQGCRACLVYQNVYDNNNVLRRCCTSGCGESGTIGDYDGRTAYFCSSNLCNGIGAENALTNGTVITSSAVSSTRTATTTTRTTTIQTSFSCYECSGSNEQPCTATMSNCPMCMVYRSDSDPTKFDRRCCWWGCGAPNQVSEYSSKPTYFCNADKCNGPDSEAILASFTPTTRSTAGSTLTTTTTTTRVTTQKTTSQCYDCSGSNCGKEGSTTSSNCPSCMAYRNPDDQTKIVRGCCWWNCGASNTVSIYNGLETYFCTGDKCNGYGVESALSPPVTRSTTTASSTRATTPSVTTTSTTVTTQKTSSQCYECSGPNCGKEGSATSSNCPSCMAYRNPDDQTKIVRGCCWWNCGASNTVSIHNGLETYFCTGDKCNEYGVESALSLPVTTTAASTITTASTIKASITTTSVLSTSATTITPSSSSCVLNCQNGGTPETENGCFCYCLDNTNGRECENVDCAQPDVDSEVCSSENQSLCGESENFAFECHHLCGKC